jgi:hypothetical protein
VEAFLSLPDGRLYRVRDGMTIGRYETNDVVLDDKKASRRHARVLFEHGVAEIEDLGSDNGVLLNGKRIDRRVLKPGDEIRIGATTLRFVEDPVAARTAGADPPRGPAQGPPPTPAFLDEDPGDEALVDVVDPIDDGVPAGAVRGDDDRDAAVADDYPSVGERRRRAPARRRGINPFVLLLTWLAAFVMFSVMGVFVLLVLKQKYPECDIYKLLEWLRDTFPERFPRPK